MKTKDKLVQKVIERIAKRSDAGIKKFNCTMMQSKKPTVAWIDDIQEELADGIIYLEKLKTLLEEEEEDLSRYIGGTTDE
jgi:hypothetical protein